MEFANKLTIKKSISINTAKKNKELIRESLKSIRA